LISENSTCCEPVQVRPEAFRMRSFGSPPSTGATRCPS
jgi:hypothetical protein